MTSISVDGVAYSVEDRRDGTRAVTCRRGVGGTLVSSVVLPPAAIPVIGDALHEQERIVITLEDAAKIEEIVNAAVDAAKIEARESAITDLQAEHDAVIAKLQADNADVVAKLNADLEQIRAELAAKDAKAQVVPIEKARAAKESKPAKSTTRRRAAPAKK